MAFFNNNLRNLQDVNVNLQDGRNLRQQELNEAELRWNLRMDEEERKDEEIIDYGGPHRHCYFCYSFTLCNMR